MLFNRRPRGKSSSAKSSRSMPWLDIKFACTSSLARFRPLSSSSLTGQGLDAGPFEVVGGREREYVRVKIGASLTFRGVDEDARDEGQDESVLVDRGCRGRGDDMMIG